MIPSPKAVNLLKSELKYNDFDLHKINKFIEYLLLINKKYNLISQSSQNDIWTRHILDSAQLVKFIGFDDDSSLSDLDLVVVSLVLLSLFLIKILDFT